MKRTAIAIAFALLAGSASADVLIDFNGVSNGASVNDFYNGGTDSRGNIGINYGVRFNGGVVNNGVVTGPFSITFAPTNNVSQVNFLMAQTLAEQTMLSTFTTLYGESRTNVDNTTNPNCRSLTREQCIAAGFRYIAPDELFSNRIFSDGLAGLFRIDFNVSLADNIRFTSATWNGPTVSGTVPEPATLALLGLGALGLLRRRKVQ